MSEASSIEVESAADVVPHVQLRDIAFLEQSARRADGGFQDLTLPEAEDESPTQFNLLMQRDEQQLTYRLAVRVITQSGEVKSDVAGRWELDENLSISDEVSLEFANKVAVFSLFPYIRESVHQLSSTVLRQPLLLPMIRQGEMEFSATGAEDKNEPQL